MGVSHWPPTLQLWRREGQVTKWPECSETARWADIAGAGERPSGAEAKLGPASLSNSSLPLLWASHSLPPSRKHPRRSVSEGPCCPVPRSNSA